MIGRPDPGNYNAPPVGMKEISEKEFAQSSFFVYSFVATEYRQVLINKKYMDIKIFWMNIEPDQADGFAVHNDYWGGKVTYYRVGCEHKYKEMSQDDARKEGHQHFGMCYHVSKCTKCGKVISYDSSG